MNENSNKALRDYRSGLNDACPSMESRLIPANGSLFYRDIVSANKPGNVTPQLCFLNCSCNVRLQSEPGSFEPMASGCHQLLNCLIQIAH